jgi:methanogenic corrinoid protein MtbC1
MDEVTQGALVGAILDGDDLAAPEAALAAIAAGAAPAEIIAVVNGAARELGLRFQSGDCYLPELVAGADAMTAVLDAVLPALERSAVKPAGTVVVGVVEGDVHDIGKRIVAAMLAGAGFRVHDLGTDVPAAVFSEKAAELGADIVAASAYITTTTQRLPEVNRALAEAGLRERVKYLIGGAGVSRGMTAWAGADAFGENAAEAIEAALQLMAERVATP